MPTGIVEFRAFVTAVKDDERTKSPARGEGSGTREALVGRTIGGRFRLRALLGGGGMGAVYAADSSGGGEVAIKVIDAELAKKPETVARFAREARAMSAIRSPHIVTVFDVGTDEGRPWIAMERLHGEDLGQRLRRDRRLPVGEAVAIVGQVLDGLASAHGAGIVHRDLKPDNVFLVNGSFAKILDFGVSKIERPRDRTVPLALTGVGTILGTPFYMSPEQAQAKPELDARADLFSLGAILFECLTGRPPHIGESHEQILVAICLNDAPDVRTIDPALPAGVADFLHRALARDPAQRFPSAVAMREALLAPVAATGVAPRPHRGSLTTTIIIGVVAMIVGIVSTLVLIELFGR